MGGSDTLLLNDSARAGTEPEAGIMRNWITGSEDPPPFHGAADGQTNSSPGTGKAGAGAAAVATPSQAQAQAQEQSWSPKTEWSRAFALMLVALLAGALATIVGIRAVEDQVQKTAAQLRRDSSTVSAVRTALDMRATASRP